MSISRRPRESYALADVRRARSTNERIVNDAKEQNNSDGRKEKEEKNQIPSIVQQQYNTIRGGQLATAA